MRTARVELFRFCAVGTVGFAADASVTLALSQWLSLGALVSRLGAFAVAVCITWALNRRYTFARRAGIQSLGAYAVATSLGAAINVGIYLAWIAAVGRSPGSVLAGVGLGSAVALGFNFVVSRYLVFGRQPP